MPHPQRSFGLTALAVLLISMAGCGEKLEPTVLSPEEPRARAATDAVSRFHDALAQGQYAEMCRTSEPGAFSTTTGLACPEFLKMVHDKMGSVVKSELTKPISADRREGSPSRVELEYKTQFESGEAKERFGCRVTGAQVNMYHYSIEAAALSK